MQLAQQVRAECKECVSGHRADIQRVRNKSEAGTLSKCGNAIILQKPFILEKSSTL